MFSWPRKTSYQVLKISKMLLQQNLTYSVFFISILFIRHAQNLSMVLLMIIVSYTIQISLKKTPIRKVVLIRDETASSSRSLIAFCWAFLKLVSAIFYQIFIFCLNDSPLKTVGNVFYFNQKGLFVLEVFKFLKFFPFPRFPDSKGQKEVE